VEYTDDATVLAVEAAVAEPSPSQPTNSQGAYPRNKMMIGKRVHEDDNDKKQTSKP
jgi:hypothetical protein